MSVQLPQTATTGLRPQYAWTGNAVLAFNTLTKEAGYSFGP